MNFRALMRAWLFVGCVAFLGCDKPAPVAASASASASAAPKSGADEVAEFVTFYEGFVKAVSENVEDCDRMAEALKAATADEKFKRRTNLESKTAEDPGLAALLGQLMNDVDAKYPNFEQGIKACGKNPDVRAAVKRIVVP